MVSRLRQRTKGAIRQLREFVPAIRRSAGPRLRWDSLRESGVVGIGNHSYGYPSVYAWNNETKLTIGKFCSIAEEVVFVLGGEHRMDWVTTFPFNVLHRDWPEAKFILGHPASKGEIVIGNDVWIGHGALILSGVRVGDGAVIGAGAVVTKNVDDYSVVAGNPAIFVRYRFDEPTRIELKRISWWNWPDEKISKNLSKLMASPHDSNLKYL